MNVAVNGSMILEAKTKGELFGAFPAEEGLINGGTVWMAANIALNAVVGGARVLAALGGGILMRTVGPRPAGGGMPGRLHALSPAWPRESAAKSIVHRVYYIMVNGGGQGEGQA